MRQRPHRALRIETSSLLSPLPVCIVTGVLPLSARQNFMRNDIELKTEDGVTLRGWHFVPEGAKERRRPSSWRTASQPLRRCISIASPMPSRRRASPRWSSTTATSAQATARLVRKTPYSAAGPRLPRRHHLRREPERNRRRAHRNLGDELQRRPCSRGGCGRSPGEVHRFAGVPLVSGHDTPAYLRTVEQGCKSCLSRTGAAAWQGSRRQMMPVVAEDQSAPSAIPTPDSGTWFTETRRTRAPSWQNEVTLRSVEMFRRV